MSFTINSMVFKVFLPILVGLAIFGTLDSIKVNSLDPNVNSLDNALGSLDSSVTFGDIDNEEKARQEVKEAILYNIIIAQKCNLLKPLYEAEWRQIQPGNPDEDVVFFEGSASEPFEVSRDEELSITCVGAKSPKEMVDVDAEDLREGADTSNTNDMEGRFGRIDFKTEETLVFEDPRIGSTSLYKDGFGFSGNFPDFWRNDRVAMMLPTGLQTNNCPTNVGPGLKHQAVMYPDIERIKTALDGDVEGSGDNEDINVYNGGQNLIYAFRVRMQNVPIVKEGYINRGKDLTLCSSDVITDLKEFMVGQANNPNSKPAKYVLCKGATGYIQSNAGSMENTGETEVGTVDWVRGFGTEIVYPKLLVRQKSSDCIEKEPGLTVENRDDILSPRLDFGSGSRETCSFQEAQNYRSSDQNSRDWNGLNVKCGLVEQEIEQNGGGGFKYYNTVWYRTGDSCLEEADILELYEIEGGYNGISMNYGEEGIRIMGGTDEERKVGFDLSRFSEINQVEIRYANYGGSMDVVLNEGEMTLKSIGQRNGDDHEYIAFKDHEDIDWQQVEENWQPREEGEEPVDDGYKLTINSNENNLKWEWFGGIYQYPQSADQPDLPDQIDSIEFQQLGDDNSIAEIRSVKVSGDSEC